MNITGIIRQAQRLSGIIGAGHSTSSAPLFAPGASIDFGGGNGVQTGGTGGVNNNNIYNFGAAENFDSGDFTVQVLFRPKNYQAFSNHQRCGIVSKYGASSGWVLFAIYYPSTSEGGIKLYTKTAREEQEITIGPPWTAAPAGLMDVAFSVSGGNITAYFNGEISVTPAAWETDRTAQLRLGTVLNWVPTDCEIYSLLCYPRALTAAEVKQNYDSMLQLVSPYGTYLLTPPQSFYSGGGSLTPGLIYGNIGGVGQQSGSDWVIPYTIGGATGNITMSAALGAGGLTSIPSAVVGNTREKMVYVMDNYNPSTGVVTHHTVGTHTFDGTETIGYSSNRYTWTWSGTTDVSNDAINCYCTHYPERTANDVWTNRSVAGYTGCAANSNRQILFVDRVNAWSSADGFKAWLAEQYAAGTPVTVCYVQTSTTESAAALPAISALPGANRCSIGGTIQPPVMELTGHIRLS